VTGIVVDEMICRACGGHRGEVVLDLGKQPAADYFPRADDPGPDPVYPLQMWLCAACGLAQLVDDATVPEEPKGTEPAALVAQSVDAIDRVAAAGLLQPGYRVLEHASPHGGSWLGHLAGRGVIPAAAGEPSEVVLDCFGLMHERDQARAIHERTSLVAPGGVLLVQYHSIETIVRLGQWNALRHGHYGYYSATALADMFAGTGFSPLRAWQFDLYGGTVLLAATRDTDGDRRRDASVEELLAGEARAGVRDPAVLRALERDALERSLTLHRWLAAERDAGRSVLGYGAASRAVALLVRAGVDRTLLPGVVDASPAKQGLRMPGTDIPIVAPRQLAAHPPASVLLFVPDLLPEVRAAFPEVEESGNTWVDADRLGA
jgi:hypothetical protein